MNGEIAFEVNGTAYSIPAEPARPLLTALRDELGLTGTKYGCGEGQCGACTVLIGGTPRRSCVTPVRAVAGLSVVTIEGLEQNGGLHPLQEAFLEHGALQCGYCTPGMIVSGAGLLAKNPNPSRGEIVGFMRGNICRCGTYKRIVEAIQTAAKAVGGGGR